MDKCQPSNYTKGGGAHTPQGFGLEDKAVIPPRFFGKITACIFKNIHLK